MFKQALLLTGVVFSVSARANVHLKSPSSCQDYLLIPSQSFWPAAAVALGDTQSEYIGRLLAWGLYPEEDTDGQIEIKAALNPFGQPTKPKAVDLLRLNREYNARLFLSLTGTPSLRATFDGGLEVYLPARMWKDQYHYEYSKNLLETRLKLIRSIEALGFDVQSLLKQSPFSPTPLRLSLTLPDVPRRVTELSQWLKKQRNFGKVRLYAMTFELRKILGYSISDEAVVSIESINPEAVRHEFEHASNWIDRIESPTAANCGRRIRFFALDGPKFPLHEVYANEFSSDEVEANIAGPNFKSASQFTVLQTSLLAELKRLVISDVKAISISAFEGELFVSFPYRGQTMGAKVPGLTTTESDYKRVFDHQPSAKQMERLKETVSERLLELVRLNSVLSLNL